MLLWPLLFVPTLKSLVLACAALCGMLAAAAAATTITILFEDLAQTFALKKGETSTLARLNSIVLLTVYFFAWLSE